MRLAHFARDGKTRVGIVSKDRILPLDALAQSSKSRNIVKAKSIEEVLRRGQLGDLERLTKGAKSSMTGSLPLNSVKLKSPILSPEKIFCAAVNYASHGKEQASKPPEAPYFFTKFRNALEGPNDPIILPRSSKKMDWEVELAVIVGRRGKYISKADALDYVAGYAVANDVSFRDLLFHEALVNKPTREGLNWVMGKGLDSALPLGPWLVTKDEIPNPRGLAISLSVNGNVRQNSNTSELIFGVEDMVESLSQGITLEPGDIITTGTPAGVAAFTGGPYLKPGDVVEARIEKIGALRNTVELDHS